MPIVTKKIFITEGGPDGTIDVGDARVTISAGMGASFAEAFVQSVTDKWDAFTQYLPFNRVVEISSGPDGVSFNY